MSIKLIDHPEETTYESTIASVAGCYWYIDIRDDTVAYFGKDNNIKTKLRHRNHMAPSRYNDQLINKVLQDNPEHFRYEVVCVGEISLMEDIEGLMIDQYKAIGQCKYNIDEEL